MLAPQPTSKRFEHIFFAIREKYTTQYRTFEASFSFFCFQLFYESEQNSGKTDTMSYRTFFPDTISFLFFNAAALLNCANSVVSIARQMFTFSVALPRTL